MTLLAEGAWKLKYTPEDGDLVRVFYVPALEDAVRYDRLTGYFSAQALSLAARGIEALIRNEGRMRLIVGCTLNAPEIEAIERGEALRALVEKRLATVPLDPPDARAAQALELVAWMVACGILDVRIAIPCDAQRRPVADSAIFHEKSGIVEDRVGDRLAWSGSLNETGAGWSGNWESINVYTSFGPEPGRVQQEEENFARLWADKSTRVITLDVPTAVRDDLLRFLPRDGAPPRVVAYPEGGTGARVLHSNTEKARNVADKPADRSELRRLVWGYIRHAPTMPAGGERVGEATCAVTPWPHQVRAFERLYTRWPPKLLIADEVGLGKTIQAGLLLRQAWLAGRARRVLVLAPKAVLRQWQVELREKFNLNWPIYDGQRLIWYPSPMLRGREVRAVAQDAWHKEPIVITSSQLMRRQARAAEILGTAEPWDLVILDEAHHARRRAAGTPIEGGPNALLRLMQGLREKTQGLVLLTATPMQVHPVEVWDLLNLLGLPPEWTAAAFLRFFEEVEAPAPAQDAFDRMAVLFQAVERTFGAVATEDARKALGVSNIKANRILRALRDAASTPRRQLETPERAAALRLMRLHTPVGRLVSRHTRELLRRYFRAGMLTTPIAERRVEDRFIDMSEGERSLYEALEAYIESTYNQAAAKERNAVGFVMTIYRRRLASSLHALGETLSAHLDAVGGGGTAALIARAEDDSYDDAAADEVMDAEEAAELERQALVLEERGDIEALLARIRVLPADSKVRGPSGLVSLLAELRADGYRQVMIFTQYTDTMDFLRSELGKEAGLRLMCFSGRGGEIASADGSWRVISRDDAKRRFRDQEADVLLCTDAAAEGLNFQFCGALVNYDMPWNPMRVEQRIGRIDRLGQKFPVIRIVNMHYNGTVETDVYHALRTRIGLFEAVVGKLQPILARLPRTISETILAGGGRDDERRANAVAAIELETMQAGGFDLDAVVQEDLAVPERPAARLTLEDLNRVLNLPAVLPSGVQIEPLGLRDYAYLGPGMKESVRVTTDPEFYEEHTDSVELWSPGSPAFSGPDEIAPPEEIPQGASVAVLLEG